ncbi:MAG: hypothetical protein ACP5QG_04475 [candidate division WOR-3 bacterium]
MKRLSIVGLFALSCSVFAPRELNLSYEVADNGRSVLVSWDAVDGASWYRVSVDGVAVDSVQAGSGTSFKIPSEQAGKVIKVEAVGTDISEEIDLSPYRTELILFSREDPDTLHPEAAGLDYYYFERYFISDTANWSRIDFYIGDENGDDTTDINSPRVYGINNEYNMSALWGTGNCAPDTGYALTTDLVQGGEYALWMSYDREWGLADNFARIVVDSVDSFRVEISIYYQIEYGLKWVGK